MPVGQTLDASWLAAATRYVNAGLSEHVSVRTGTSCIDTFLDVLLCLSLYRYVVERTGMS